MSEEEARVSSSQAKAKSIIEDAFRRADKNDDGSLSLQEFQSYFADGILSSSQLEEIFRQIDTHKTNNLDVGELCEYFAQFWGPFEHIFAILDDLGKSVTHAMKVTAENYGGHTFLEQFATRHLMKETLSHMSALEGPINSAIDRLEEETIKQGGDKEAHPPSGASSMSGETPQHVKVSKPRWQQRLGRSMSVFSEASESLLLQSYGNDGLSAEVSRLANLVSKLESKIKLEMVEEEEVAEGEQGSVVLVSRKMEVAEESTSRFKAALKNYAEFARQYLGCLHVTLQVFTGTSQFVVFEVWKDEQSMHSCYSAKSSKEFLHTCVDVLEKSESRNQFLIPASWWPEDCTT